MQSNRPGQGYYGYPVVPEEERYRSAAAYVELDRRHRKRSRWTTVLVVAVIVLIASLAMLGVIWFSYYQGQQKYGDLEQYASVIDSGHVQEGTQTTSPFEGFAVDWESLHAINPDVVAWISIPGTQVNYPVVRGTDNEYYLTHDFNGDEGWLANYGAVFMDFRNSPDWSDDAYFIYGHHMNDGSMFAAIAGLEDQQRFDASRTVYLLSPQGNFMLRTFSLIHCPADDPLVQTTFESDKALATYVQDKMNRSIVDVSDTPPTSELGVPFAFATCDNVSGGRYVLYAYVEQTDVTNLDGAGTKSQPSTGQVKDLKREEPAEETESSTSAEVR